MEVWPAAPWPCWSLYCSLTHFVFLQRLDNSLPAGSLGQTGLRSSFFQSSLSLSLPPCICSFLPSQLLGNSSPSLNLKSSFSSISLLPFNIYLLFFSAICVPFYSRSYSPISTLHPSSRGPPAFTFSMVCSRGATGPRNNSKSLHIAGTLVSAGALLHWHISLSGMTLQTAYAMTNSCCTNAHIHTQHRQLEMGKKNTHTHCCCLWGEKHVRLRSRQL